MSSEVEHVGFYTRARRIPTLIGVVGRTRLFGGPYNLLQFFGGPLVVVVLWQTRGLWARGSVIEGLIILAGAFAASVFLLGKVPLTGRNPLSWLSCFLRALTGPRHGRYRGKKVTAPRHPRRMHFRITMPADALSTPATDPPRQPAPPRHHPEPTPQTDTAPALTEVQQLLASAGRGGNPHA